MSSATRTWRWFDSAPGHHQFNELAAVKASAVSLGSALAANRGRRPRCAELFARSGGGTAEWLHGYLAQGGASHRPAPMCR